MFDIAWYCSYTSTYILPLYMFCENGSRTMHENHKRSRIAYVNVRNKTITFVIKLKNKQKKSLCKHHSKDKFRNSVQYFVMNHF